METLPRKKPPVISNSLIRRVITSELPVFGLRIPFWVAFLLALTPHVTDAVIDWQWGREAQVEQHTARPLPPLYGQKNGN